MIEFRMPSLGADMEAGTLVEWLIKPGDKVKRGDIIAMVDTQKGLIDIEVFDEGIVHELQVKEHQKVPVGTVMALIEDGTAQPVKKEEQVPVIAESGKVIEPIRPSEMAHGIKVSPLAKRIAAEKGIDLATVHGTGEGGAISREDVERALAEKMAPQPEPKTAGSEGIRRAIASAMSRSNREIPHYYLETKIDMSRALAWLRETNGQKPPAKRILPVILLIKAVAKALTEVPDLNGYWENTLQKKSDINIGFVVSLRSGGLMIPAIHQADKRSPEELMLLLNDIIPRARAMKLRSSELSDSTITLTSLGEDNVETVYGLIYPPQVAIVGFGSISEQPCAVSGMLDVRPMLHVTLAADHRATDGATGSRFLMAVKKYLQTPEDL